MSDDNTEIVRRDNGGQRNPFSGDRIVAVAPSSSLTTVEQQKAIAEVQARMIIARSNPRDPQKAMDAILRDCTRATLASRAIYQFARGGSDISGPSIRLAEAIAQRWGNIASGIKELTRSNGYSECAAYAWDLETGYYDERQFQVRHWRDTKKGGHAITDERDIYELIANMGQRRKRAVLLTVIPGDVVEAAVEQCEETMKADADTSPAALQKMVKAFGGYGVSQAQIEKRIQRKLEGIRPAQVIQLRKIYASLSDEMSKAEDWFEPEAKGVWGEIEARHRASAETPAQPTRESVREERAKAAAQERQEATAEGDAGERREDPPADPPAAREQPEAGENADEFEVVLFDSEGVEVEPFTDARAFAESLVALWDRADGTGREALAAHNADGIEDARTASQEAWTLLTRLDEPYQEQQAEPEPEPPVVIPLPVAGTRDSWRGWLGFLRENAVKLSAERFRDFVAANRANIRQAPNSQRVLAIKALVERATALGLDPGGLKDALSPAPEAPKAAASQPAEQPTPNEAEAPQAASETPEPPLETKPDKDAILCDNLIAAMVKIADPNTLRTYTQSVVVMTPMRRWERDRPELADRLRAAGERRDGELRSAASENA